MQHSHLGISTIRAHLVREIELVLLLGCFAIASSQWINYGVNRIAQVVGLHEPRGRVKSEDDDGGRAKLTIHFHCLLYQLPRILYVLQFILSKKLLN